MLNMSRALKAASVPLQRFRATFWALRADGTGGAPSHIPKRNKTQTLRLGISVQVSAAGDLYVAHFDFAENTEMGRVVLRQDATVVL